jgi:4-alpha-glucanotransferase
MFSEEGQNWGFPVYDWRQNYQAVSAFWTARLREAAIFFDLYRIDHVPGFFRIWTIPDEQEATSGFFDPQVTIPARRLQEEGFNVQKLLADNILIPFLGDSSELAFSWYFWREPAFTTMSDKRQHKLRQLEQEYTHSQNSLWAQVGIERLTMLSQAAAVLPCAEDLGVVPECVPAVLNDLGIPGLRVLRWSRHWQDPWQPFVGPAEQDELAVLTTSVHDSEPLLDWWHQAPQQERQAFWQSFLDWQGPATADMSQETYGYFLQKVYQANNRLVINPLADLLAKTKYFPDDPAQYKINTPGTVSRDNWALRYSFCTEDLANEKETILLVSSYLGNRQYKVK